MIFMTILKAEQIQINNHKNLKIIMADTNFITAEKIKGIIENQIIDNKDFVST